MTMKARLGFVYFAPRRSGALRGMQVAAALGVEAVRLRDFDVEVGRRFDVLVYVKELPELRVMEALRRHGVRQVVDVLDNFDWRRSMARLQLADALIAANLTHRIYLQRRFRAPVVAIPHHHCNFDDVRIPAGRTPPTLGYVGRKDDWWLNRWMLRGLRHPVVSDFKHGRLVDSYRTIDIGFAYRRHAQKRSFNSAVKLVNYMSFGIPSVLTPESGYLEIARHGTECFYAQSGADFRLLLAYLATDAPARQAMGEAAFEAARPYHIARVAELYREFLQGV